jgi:hypothetical protein
MHQTFFWKQKLTYSGLNELADDVSDNTKSHDHTEGVGGTGKKLTSSGLEDSGSPEIRDYDAHAPYIVTGLLPATSANLTSNISAGEGYAPDDAGKRLVRVLKESATSHTYNASKDTYVYLHPYQNIHGGDDGFFHFNEVANGAGEPSLPDSSVKLAKVVTNGTQITSVSNLRQTGSIDENRIQLPLNGLLREIRYYTSNDTWSKPAGLKFVVVEIVGGGGGGGGTSATTGTSGGAAGGGGGEYSRKKIAVTSLGATESVTVGNGGSAGAANGSGGGGGTSSFGSHASASGGSGGGGGAGNATQSSHFQGGVGGVGGSGGDITIEGGHGIWSWKGAGVDAIGGRGGNAGLGFGGGGRATRVTGNSAANGNSGNLYGGGGGGGASNGTGGNATGGIGAVGIVIVYEYY